jgi:ATP-dependent NAD(P)H-hydrate dehydratase
LTSVHSDELHSEPGRIPISKVPFLSAIGASMVTRTASRRAFHKEGRGVITEDMIPEIGKAFAEVFGEELQGKDKGKL